MITIPNTRNLRDEIAPLYHRYPGQSGPQPAYLALDEGGCVTVDYDGELGNAVPMNVWHRRTLRFYFDGQVRGSAIADLLEDDEVASLLMAIHDGHSVEWDGSNHAGRFTEAAQAAIEALESLIETRFTDYDLATVYSAGDYLSSVGLLDNWPANATLEAAVERLEQEAESDGYLIDGDLASELLELAERQYEREPDSLSQVHIDALRADGRIDDDQEVA